MRPGESTNQPPDSDAPVLVRFDAPQSMIRPGRGDGLPPRVLGTSISHDRPQPERFKFS